MATFDKLLLLDLDETLIHASSSAQTGHFRVGNHHVLERPHVGRFLQFAFQHFTTVAVWTAASRGYAESVLHHLLGQDFASRLAFVWCYERCRRGIDFDTGCWSTEKPLRKVRRRGYDLAKVLFVEDTPANLRRSYGNLVPVRPFVGDPADDELLCLESFLLELGALDDVRRHEKRNWRARTPRG
jgi:TFIIF-interacting CTD phosphatase-like protein